MNQERQCNTLKFEEDPCIKHAKGIAMIRLEILLLIKFLQIRPQVKVMIKKYYDLHYFVSKNLTEDGEN